MDEACPKCGADDGIAGKCAAMFVAQNAEITRLRAQLAEVRRDAGESVVLLGGERDYLLAERAANNELYSISQSDLAAASLQYDAATAVIERLETAARQDAEAIARLRGLLREAGNELSIYTTPIELVERIRAALACRPQAVLQPLTADQKEYLQSIERTIGDYDPSAVIGRPQPEAHTPAHGPFPGAPFSPKVERS